MGSIVSIDGTGEAAAAIVLQRIASIPPAARPTHPWLRDASLRIQSMTPMVHCEVFASV
jgi:hypothetical protein